MVLPPLSFAFVSHNGSVTSRFWLSVGDQETRTEVRHPPTDLHQEFSRIAGVESAALVEALRFA